MVTEIHHGYANEIINALNAITPETVPDKLNPSWTRKIKEDMGANKSQQMPISIVYTSGLKD